MRQITKVGLLTSLSIALAHPPAQAAERLSLTTSTASELATLPEVGDELASAIVALREDRHGLNSVEELRVLSGASERALNSLRTGTVVEVELPISASAEYSTVADVMGAFESEPTIQQLQGWVMVYSKTNPETLESWLRASKRFALLPEVQIEYKLKDGWDQDWDYYAADGVIDSDDEAVFDVLSDAGRDRDAYYVAKAKWRFDELIMSSERVRVINEAQDIVKLRDKVLSNATKVYFDRRELQVQVLLKPKSDLQSQIKDQLRLMELTAQLDALSGGAFSANL